jgi:hypothetical protein
LHPVADLKVLSHDEVLAVRIQLAVVCAVVSLVVRRFLFIDILLVNSILLFSHELSRSYVLLRSNRRGRTENMWVLFLQLLKHFGAVLRLR